MQKFRILLVLALLSMLHAGIIVAQWNPSSVDAPGFAGPVFCFTSLVNDTYAGTNNGVYKSTAGGAWARIDADTWTGIDIRALAADLSGDIVAGTDGSGIFFFNGTGWAHVNSGVMVDATVPAVTMRGVEIFAGVKDMGVVKSSDGVNWSPADERPTNFTAEILSLVTIGTDLYAGTYGSGVYRSTDAGATWAKVDSAGLDALLGTTVHDVRSLAVIGTKLFAAIYDVGANMGYGVYVSDNGGPWAAATNDLGEARVFALAASGTHLFAATNGGGVYRTDNDGASWTQVNTGLLPLTVQALGMDPSNIYAGTGTGIFQRTLSEALPVELTSFTASSRGAIVVLQWKTATETNNHGFGIERKRAADAAWSAIGFVDGAGTSNSPHTYTFSDNTTASGRCMYRLRQIDRDGRVEYSHAIEAGGSAAATTFALGQNYPNPFNPSTTISFSVPENGRAIVTVFNAIGQHVATLFDGNLETGITKDVVFNASHLPSGVYFSRLEFNGKHAMKKIVLMK